MPVARARLPASLVTTVLRDYNAATDSYSPSSRPWGPGRPAGRAYYPASPATAAQASLRARARVQLVADLPEFLESSQNHHLCNPCLLLSARPRHEKGLNLQQSLYD